MRRRKCCKKYDFEWDSYEKSCQLGEGLTFNSRFWNGSKKGAGQKRGRGKTEGVHDPQGNYVLLYPFWRMLFKINEKKVL